MLWTQACGLYEAHLGDLQRSPKTLARRRQALKLFGLWWGQGSRKDLATLDGPKLEAYLRWLRAWVSPRTGKVLAPATVANAWTALGQVLALLHEDGLLERNPLAALAPLRVPARAPVRVVLDEDQMTRLLESVDTATPRSLRLRAVLELAYACGLRASELGGLRWDRLDLTERRVLILGGKGGRDRVVPLTRTAAAWLGQLRRLRPREPYVCGRRPASPTTLNKHWKQIAQACGLAQPGLSFHSLRHSCATHLLKHGADIRYVQALLGHTSVETTLVYLHEGPVWLKRQYNSFHPRQNQLYKDLEGSEAQAWESFAAELEAADQRRLRAWNKRAQTEAQRRAPRRRGKIPGPVLDSNP